MWMIFTESIEFILYTKRDIICVLCISIIRDRAKSQCGFCGVHTQQTAVSAAGGV